MPGVGLGTMFVTPYPHSGRRPSSQYPIGSGTSLDSYSSFQKRFEKPAK